MPACFSMLLSVPIGMSRTGCGTVTRPYFTGCLTSRTTIRPGLLFGFYANVSEPSKVLIERGYRHVFGRRSCGDQAVHEMDFCFSIAIQSVQVNRRINFNTWAGNES